MTPAFDCRRCGHCCAGEGGIVLSPGDAARLAGHLGLAVDAFLAAHAEAKGRLPRLLTGADGYCEFYDHALPGCGVHPARPDVCRAWPFFRGNLLDAGSWAMISEDCPGVERGAGHAGFAAQGREYMREHGLFKPRGPETPEALVPPWPEDLRSGNSGDAP